MWRTICKMIYRIRQFFRNIKRVFYWIPLLWEDRWFDSSWLLLIMEKKLRYDADHYMKYHVAVGGERRAKQMLTCAILCKRLASDDYKTPWDAGARESSWRMWNYMVGNVKKVGSLIIHTSEGYVEDPKLSREFRWATEREDEMKQQDRDLLFKIMKKHLFYWWD